MNSMGLPGAPSSGPRRVGQTWSDPAPPVAGGAARYAQNRPGPGHGVYGISVAANLVGMQVHSLRLYEQRGLVAPARTAGGTRRYSDNDLDRLRRIGQLLTAGVNLVGIAVILELEAENVLLRHQLATIRAHRSEAEDPSARSGRSTSGQYPAEG